MIRRLLPAVAFGALVAWAARTARHPANWGRHLTAPYGAEVLEFPLHRHAEPPPVIERYDPQAALAAEMAALAERDAQGDRCD